VGLAAPGIMVGMDNIKVVHPAEPYDSLYIDGEVLTKRLTSRGDRYVMKVSFNIRNQKDELLISGDLTELYPNPDKS
jgi:acyl dehydratase